jgi:hypothetical protein
MDYLILVRRNDFYDKYVEKNLLLPLELGNRGIRDNKPNFEMLPEELKIRISEVIFRVLILED